MTAPAPARRFLLDADVFIEWTRNTRGNTRVRDWVNRIVPRLRILCPIVLGETLRGVDNAPSRSLRQRELRELRRSRKWGQVDITDDTAAVWAAMMNAAPVGSAQPNNDSWVAALALRHRLTVLTRNRRHLSLYGVDTIDPWSAPWP